MTPSEMPLCGVRVLDLTRVLAGPFCTMLLADLGADVVKVERPEGDDARQYGPFLPSGESAYFAGINRGKRSIVLDMKSETHRAIFLRLVEKADVVVENFRPGTMEAFGLGSERLRTINPRLIYASVSGFGRTGPYRRRPAYDIIVQALGGLMSITGHDSSEPARVGTSISDILAGIYTALSITATLARRGRTGNGADLDLAMLDCTVSVLENAVSRYAITGQMPQPLGTRHPSITPFQAFRAADGMLVIAAGNDTLWRKVCELIGRPALADDPLLTTNALRTANQPYLEGQLNALLSSRRVADWLEAFTNAGIPAAPIQNIAQVMEDPQLAARDMWHTLVDRDGATLVTPSSPVVLDNEKPPLGNTWPRLGEHQEEVLREWLLTVR
jgi:crotonobetainyl-CoA:carnitine CoA-transferase CaiB-like acyl-CoA transferase